MESGTQGGYGMFWDLRQSSVAVDGGTVDYAAFGKGKTPLVILPGLSLRDVRGAGAGRAWLYRRFAREYRIYVIDKKSDISEDHSKLGYLSLV